MEAAWDGRVERDENIERNGAARVVGAGAGRCRLLEIAGGAARRAVADARSVLHRVPQRRRARRRAVARGHHAGRGRRAPGEMGTRRAPPARQRDAAARRPAPRRRRRSASSSRRSKRISTAAARAHGENPGDVVLHRLNRVEYATRGARSARLRGRREPLAAAGCRRATASTTSPRCCASRRRISISTSRPRATSAIKAVGNPAPRSGSRRVPYPKVKNHSAHVDGLPLGTRDGLIVEHYFPADGEYVFNLRVSSEPGAELRAYPQGWLEYEHTVDPDDRRRESVRRPSSAARTTCARSIATRSPRSTRSRIVSANIRLPVKAGVPRGRRDVHRAQLRGIRLTACRPSCRARGFPTCRRCSAWRSSDRTSRPASARAPRDARARYSSATPRPRPRSAVCRAHSRRRLARLAFRRPATEADIERAARVLSRGRASRRIRNAAFRRACSRFCRARNSSIEPSPAGRRHEREPGAAYAVTDLELASRLAFFLWSQGPDEELLALAESNRLSDPQVYAQQVDRMLADPRSKSLVTNFAFQWLSVRDIDVIDPDPKLYPNFDDDLRACLRARDGAVRWTASCATTAAASSSC